MSEKTIMKLNTVYALLAIFLLACNQSGTTPIATPDPDPVVDNRAWFNQEGAGFRVSHVDCLIDRWRSRYSPTSKDTIILGVINSQAIYQAYFRCNSTSALPAIDFSTRTLLIGFGPIALGTAVSNISQITQNVVSKASGLYDYQVQVTGKTPGGTEFFGFAKLVPKIADSTSVRLTMSYSVK
jgi:hypothetical protein